MGKTKATFFLFPRAIAKDGGNHAAMGINGKSAHIKTKGTFLWEAGAYNVEKKKGQLREKQSCTRGQVSKEAPVVPQEGGIGICWLGGRL